MLYLYEKEIDETFLKKKIFQDHKILRVKVVVIFMYRDSKCNR